MMYRQKCAANNGFIFWRGLKNSVWAALLGAGVFAAVNLSWAEAPEPSIDAGLAQARSLSRAFERVADLITPSVVNIVATKKLRQVHGRGGTDPFFDQFRNFFGDEFAERFKQPGGPGGGGGDDGGQGLGTGVIVDTSGHILTNNHVVGEGDEITVRLGDERTFRAKLIGKDERSDLAVIKIDASNLTPARLGDSDNLKIGEWVVAAGNPFGLDNTITAGIVSAKGRSIMGGGQYEDFIQTDAAINPGNSGGPLVDLEGKVVGINTAIFSRSGGYMGIGFAIPITMARRVMNSLISSGKVVRGWLGVGIQNLSPELAESFQQQTLEGALVGHVEANGPAAKGGFRQGDIIVAVNGDKVKNVNQLRNYIAGLVPGETLSAEVIRAAKNVTLKATVGELPAATEKEAPVVEDSANDFGMVVENLTAELKQRLRTNRSSGVVVTEVRPGSPAQRAGIQNGDVVVSVNDRPVDDLGSFKSLTKSKKGVRMVVETQGMERFVFLKPE